MRRISNFEDATIAVSDSLEMMCMVINLKRPAERGGASGTPGVEEGNWAGLLRLADPDRETIGIDPLKVKKHDLTRILATDGEEAIRLWKHLQTQAKGHLEQYHRQCVIELTRREDVADLGRWLSLVAPSGVTRLVCYPSASVWPSAYGVRVRRTLNVVYPISEDPSVLLAAVCHEWAHVWLQHYHTRLGTDVLVEGVASSIGELLTRTYRHDRLHTSSSPGPTRR